MLYPIAFSTDGAALPLTSVNIASLVVLGGLVALAIRLPAIAVGAIAAFCGATHGIENGSVLAVPDVGSAAAIVVACLALAVPAAAAAGLARDRFPIVPRVAGSWIAAIGLMMIALELRSVFP